MKNTSARPADDSEIILHTYGNMLFRLCLITLGNANDAEDAVQETLIKYLQKAPRFENEAHKKAWLLTVAINQCKDILRFKKRHPVIDIDEINEFINEKSDSGILDALMTLPDKYRMVLVLYYVEEYSIESIAKMVGRTTSAVKMRLQKGRKLLSEAYRSDHHD
uniref:RNA polymerase sigma factor n=1 Tax=Acetatifactor sp. TaxID=1872090 RepID=UPI0040572A2A